MRALRACAAILICLLCLAGCQKEELPPGGDFSEEVSSSAIFSEETTEDFTVNVGSKAENFAAVGELKVEPSLWTTEYVSWEHEENDKNRLMRSVVLGDRIYQLYTVVSEENTDYKYLLEIYDTSAMQAAVTEIDEELLGMDGGFIADMSVIDSEMYAFLIMKYVREETGVFKLLRADVVYTDLKEEIRRVDLMPAIREKGLKDIFQECYCDALGNIYLRELHGNLASSHLFILDQNGSLWMDQDLGDSVEIGSPARTSGGELIFPVNDYENNTARLILFDSQEKKMCVLASLQEESIKQIYGMQGTALYYDSYDGIVKWDLASGNRSLVFSFKENSVSNIYNTMLVFRSGQLPVFRMYGVVNEQDEDWLAPLSEQEPQVTAAIQVVSLNGNSANVKDCAAMASRRNPGLSFNYKTCSEKELADFRTRVLAELVAGDGPDILYVSLEDMRRLQEMGALADLDDFFTTEMKDQILPGIIELGTVDGTFVGIAPDMHPTSIVTLKSIWDQDTWTLEDVMELMDTGDFTAIFCQGTSTFTPYALLSFLTEFGLRESALIDWETRKSHFDSDLFQRILELTKTYGNDAPLSADTWLGVGGCPGMIVIPDIEGFNELYEQYGDEYHFVGMPTEKASGNYLNSKGVLVVNKNAANPRAVSAYLNCLLDEEIQYLDRPFLNYSILKVSLKETTAIEVDGETRIFWKDHRLQIKEDGTTTLRDYKNFLESCIPEPGNYDDIVSIVWEESQSYIAGDKGAKDVARIIDSRIQIYLDEGNGG
ncbi:MAG: extracellular solute-binding protein [Acetatifactor sp.]|nr:extracellular solute-binding protein [Acetatifactor sp.]